MHTILRGALKRKPMKRDLKDIEVKNETRHKKKRANNK